MSAGSPIPPGSGAVPRFSIAQVERYGKLAVACLDSVLKIHHSAWLAPDWKPLVSLPLGGQDPAPRFTLRDEIERLTVVACDVPDYPFDDPFAGTSPVELCSVLATSAHAVCFLMARRCLDLGSLSAWVIGPTPALPGVASRPGLLSSDMSEQLRTCMNLGSHQEPPQIVWEHEAVVERIVQLMRGMFVTGVHAGMAQGEAFRAADRLRTHAQTALAHERILGRNRAEVVAEDRKAEGTSAPIRTETQRSILSALDGRALGGKELAGIVGCTLSQMHRNHLTPLMDEGAVANNRAVGGYYRPDSPPR